MIIIREILLVYKDHTQNLSREMEFTVTKLELHLWCITKIELRKACFALFPISIFLEIQFN